MDRTRSIWQACFCKYRKSTTYPSSIASGVDRLRAGKGPLEGILILVLSLAGLGLLSLGERMGLPVNIASAGVLAIVLLGGIALALFSTTSRLGRFVVGARQGSLLGFASLVACFSLFSVSVLSLGAVPMNPQMAAWLIAGQAIAFFLPGFTPWRNFVASGTAPAILRDDDPASGSRGSVGAAALAVAVMSIALAVFLLPRVLDGLEILTGWSRGALWLLVAVFSVLLPALGGMRALRRAALLVMGLALVFVLFPIGWHAASASSAWNWNAVLNVEPARFAALTFDPMSMAFGFALGLVLRQAGAAIGGWGRSLLSIVIGWFSAITLLAAVWLAADFLQQFESKISLGAPAQWPVSVFDEVLHRWVTACGTPFVDVQQALRNCGASTAREVLPPGSIRFEQTLAALAVAVAWGWPATLGFIWSMLTPLVGVVCLGVLMHAAASGLVERVGYRIAERRLLRASRLAMTRLAILVIAVGLFLADANGLRMDLLCFRWILLASTLVVLVAIAAKGIVETVRRLNQRKRRVVDEDHETATLTPASGA